MELATYRFFVDWDNDGVIEMISNGGFDSGTDWTPSGDAAISGGTLNITGTGQANQDAGITEGVEYIVRFTVTSITDGYVFIWINASPTALFLTYRTAAGAYTETFTAPAGSDGLIIIYGYTTGTISVDNISLVEADHDISAYVMNSGWSNGRSAGFPEHDTPGILQLKLDNSDGIFSSFNDASPIYGSVLPGRKVKVTMQIDGDDIATKFQGELDEIMPEVGERVTVSTATLKAFGVLQHFAEAEVEIASADNIKTGDWIDDILDAEGWPAEDREIASGLTTIPRLVISTGKNTLQVMRELADAEFGRLRESQDGKIVFEDRDQIFDSPHDTPQATYGTGTLNIWELRQEDSRGGIYNVCRSLSTAPNTTEDMDLVTVTDINRNLGGRPIRIPGSGSQTVNLEFPNSSTTSNYIGVYEWGMVYYEANTAEDGSGSDITSDVSPSKTSYGNRLQITFTNSNVSAAYLILLRVEGIAIIEGDPVPVKYSDSTSIGKYRKREYPYPTDLLTDHDDVLDWCTYAVTVCKDPRPRLSFQVKGNYDAAHLLEVQTREIGDRIRVVASLAEFSLAIDEEFIIDKLAHSVDEHRMHTMTVWCTRAHTDQLGAITSTYDTNVVYDPSRTVNNTGTNPTVRIEDTGNPSGASGLQILTNSDDSTIPEGCMAFSFNRPTSNFSTIYAIQVSLGGSSSLHGPFAAQRAANPGDVLYSGSGLTIRSGSKYVGLTVGSPPDCAGKVLLIYGTGDDQLDGNVIGTHGASYLLLTQAFYKSGTFNYSIVEPWWDLNPCDLFFAIPQDMRISDINETVWMTKPVPLFKYASAYSNLYTRNVFGIGGTLLTAGPKSLEAGWENYANNETPSADPSNFTVRVYAGTPDSESSNVELYWDYTQGANKCNEFEFTITDGSATYVYRATAVSTTGSQKHRLDITQLKKDKTVAINIAALFTGKSGIIRKTAISNAWNFTPSSSSGSSPSATLVGTLDWAGGNVWFGTSQYRNNTAPTNAPDNTLLESATLDGANQLNIALAGLGYTQGANIATHIAIFLRAGGGAISITTDQIVTLMNLASLPGSYTMAIPLNAVQSHTIGIAACALTRDGYSFNTTVRSYSFSASTDVMIYSATKDVSIQAGSGKVIKIKSDMNLDSGIVIKVNSTQVLTGQQATISDPSGGGTQDAEARAAINTIIDRLQAHGLIA